MGNEGTATRLAARSFFNSRSLSVGQAAILRHRFHHRTFVLAFICFLDEFSTRDFVKWSGMMLTTVNLGESRTPHGHFLRNAATLQLTQALLKESTASEPGTPGRHFPRNCLINFAQQNSDMNSFGCGFGTCGSCREFAGRTCVCVSRYTA
jgi:hypothetical protein